MEGVISCFPECRCDGPLASGSVLCVGGRSGAVTRTSPRPRLGRPGLCPRSTPFTFSFGTLMGKCSPLLGQRLHRPDVLLVPLLRPSKLMDLAGWSLFSLSECTGTGDVSATRSPCSTERELKAESRHSSEAQQSRDELLPKRLAARSWPDGRLPEESDVVRSFVCWKRCDGVVSQSL